MNRLIQLCVIVTCCFILIRCDKQTLNPENKENNILTVSYGTSFGFCVGYCVRKIEITQDLVEFTKSGSGQMFSDVSCTLAFDHYDYTNLTNKINIEDFLGLQEIIGCPDCADGGAEWIKITTVNKTHKVTFEYMNEPVEVKDYIGEFRMIFEGFNDCN